MPQLVTLVQGGDPAAARLIAHHWQLTQNTLDCLTELPDELRSEVQLLEFALHQDPADARARELLINRLADRLAYAIHEIPSGVLWGFDGATPEQCQELEAILDRFEELVRLDGRAADFNDFTTSCRFHFRSYAAYRLESDEQRSYADFLADDG